MRRSSSIRHRLPRRTAHGISRRPEAVSPFTTAAPSTQPAATQSAGETELPGGQTIRFGGYKDILKSSLFASLGGKDVAVVATTAEKSFEKTPLDLRNRDVMDIAPDRVSSFTVAINKPATTQPTTQPAEMREFTIERHKVAAPVLGPALPGGVTLPSTHDRRRPRRNPPSLPRQPSSRHSTQPAVCNDRSLRLQSTIASTQPATTQPDETATAKWIFTSGQNRSARC